MAAKYKIVQSVDRAFAILEQFSDEQCSLGVTTIASRVGLHKSTCFGLLYTLQHLGYLIHNPETGQYSLGLKAFELGQAYIGGLDLRSLCRPYLLDLVAKTMETVHLVIVEGQRVIYIDKVEAPHAITISSRIGQEAKLHCTGVGKVLLAHMSDTDRASALKGGLQKYTDRTIIKEPALLANLQEIRDRGFGIDDQEREIGLTCVAAPIFNETGQAVAAISISGPTLRVSDAQLAERSQIIKAATEDISRRLGYRPDRSGAPLRPNAKITPLAVPAMTRVP